MRFAKKQSFTHLGKPDPTKTKASQVGVSTKREVDEVSGKMEGTASVLRNTSVSQLPMEIDIDPLLKDIIFSEDLEQKKLVMRVYKDIYYNDPVGGCCVDFMATLPFSDFNLGGIQNTKAASAFEEAIERLNIKTLLPEANTDILVTGQFCASMLHNSTKNTFVDLITHQAENTKVDPLPFYSQDPLITVAFSDAHKAVLAREGDRMDKIREYLGADVVAQLSNDALELDPLSTIYIPRKSFTNSTGVSWFRRILPIWLIEKNLFRGTLVESARRQRGILHLMLGDGDEWEPTQAEMQMAMELFQNADADPLGAVVATRLGISADELRQGGDFWKVTDLWNDTTTMKLRALGVSETFLSGEANLNTADTGLTVLIEQMRAYRDNFTQRFFYNKLFPLISATNGFTLNNKGKLSIKGNLLADLNPMESHSLLNDGSRLLIPSVHWSKSLKPEGDSTYLDMLQTLSEKGVPVPLRAMAAAGGFNLDSLLASQEDDFETIRKLGQYKTKIEELKKEFMPQTGEDEALASALASAQNRLDNMTKGTRSDVLQDGSGRMLGLSRDFSNTDQDIYDIRDDGKKKMVYNQRAANEKLNRRIAKQLDHIAKNGNTPLTRMTKTSKTRMSRNPLR